MTDENGLASLDALVSLCKRRGYIFQGSEIYGGLNGFWDYGPLGVELRRRIFDSWWATMVSQREDVVGMDAALIMHPRVWEASGHVESFYDMMVDCRECNRRYRLDHLVLDAVENGTLDEIFPDRDNSAPPAEGELPTRCPHCGGDLTEPRQFGLMFETHVGAATDSKSVAYLRPETAQAIFVNFKNVQMSSRQKVPFGIAQVGKAFRNEVTPRNFTFRSREFEQMEMEFFVHADDEREWFDYWVAARHGWYEHLGIAAQRLRLREHQADELAHYARYTTDVEYQFPFGWAELEGIANRGNFDLSQHGEHSGKDQGYFDPVRNEKYVPSVIETSAGLDRTLLTVLADAFAVDEIGGEERTVLRLAPHVAPRQVAVFPLMKKLAEPAQALANDLRSRFHTLYDAAGSIGKRYRREDEVGTPYCVTFDFDSLEDQAVTVRDRDTTEQERVGLDALGDYLAERILR
jgi:glycyl-tRNA synthetase